VDISSKQVTLSREAVEKNDGQSGRQKQERGTGRLMSDDGMPMSTSLAWSATRARL
jgi:hypothetical protein